mgnify:CR=1 FL=1|jgi:hypothetical protein
MKENDNLITVTMITGTGSWDDTYSEEQTLTFTKEELEELFKILD